MQRKLADPLEMLDVRPLRVADRDAVAGLFERLSVQSRYRRFFSLKPYLTERELARLTDVDHVGDEALAALDAAGRIVAIARYAADRSRPATAEIAVEVADDHHGRGIGSALVRRIVERARENCYRRLTANVMWDNGPARALFKRLGFRAAGAAGAAVELELELEPACSERSASPAHAA